MKINFIPTPDPCQGKDNAPIDVDLPQPPEQQGSSPTAPAAMNAPSAVQSAVAKDVLNRKDTTQLEAYLQG